MCYVNVIVTTIKKMLVIFWVLFSGRPKIKKIKQVFQKIHHLILFFKDYLEFLLTKKTYNKPSNCDQGLE